ncbi:MAG: thiamine-phosphate kinase [Cyclobacteriaceae bacterium]|nr:thiamine-phosphate kinase [Cyclobacteriaceae bacterium]
MSNKRTELNQLGEFGLIKKIAESVVIRQKSTTKGIGDDAASIKPEGEVVISSDMLMEGIHFDLSYMPIHHLGYKAVAVNVSDIAAMNATPTQIIVNIGLSNRFSLEAIEALYEGINAACEQYKVDLVGGDTSSSASGLAISITAVGMASKTKLAYRSGAKKGDILCATGDLGAAYVGLQVLEREKQVFASNPNMQPDLEKYQYIVQKQLKPEARMDVIHELADLNIVPTSMIDISDGLASEILHLQEHSGIGFRIYEDKLPIDKMTYDTAVEFNLDPITCILNGGEDYELLFTIPQDDYEKVKHHPDIHFIGYALDNKEDSHLVTKNQNMVTLKAQGFNHLSKSDM